MTTAATNFADTIVSQLRSKLTDVHSGSMTWARWIADAQSAVDSGAVVLPADLLDAWVNAPSSDADRDWGLALYESLDALYGALPVWMRDEFAAVVTYHLLRPEAFVITRRWETDHGYPR